MSEKALFRLDLPRPCCNAKRRERQSRRAAVQQPGTAKMERGGANALHG
jgi:hypothetical protein